MTYRTFPSSDFPEYRGPKPSVYDFYYDPDGPVRLEARCDPDCDFHDPAEVLEFFNKTFPRAKFLRALVDGEVLVQAKDSD